MLTRVMPRLRVKSNAAYLCCVHANNRMRSSLRDIVGFTFFIVSLAVLFHGIVELRRHDYVASILLVFAGLSLSRGSIELLREAVGE